MRKAIIIAVVLAGLGLAGWFGYQRINAARTAAAPAWDVVRVERATIKSTVSATGAILPEQQANLTFRSTGTVSQVAVESGQQVRTGQVLAQLDTTDLQLAVRQAEIGLRQAQAQIQQLDEGPSASDLAAAQAALDSAQATYQQLLRGASKDELAAANAQVEQARATLNQAQQAYDKVSSRPDVGLLPQSLQLQQATINFETAQAQYRVTARSATAAQLAQAQAQVVQAQASLDRLNKGATETQRAIAQAGVDQATVALEQAQRRLGDAAITAPWDGIVTAVNLVQGTLVQPAVAALQMADISRFHLDVQVDEVDVAGILPGQSASIEVDALPDTIFSGSVRSVAPAAQSSATGGVTYKVRIDIEKADGPADVGSLKVGMSATATIVSSTRENVLLVPNRAVQLDRETSRTFVERLTNGEPQKVEVRLGLRDDQRVEVREGLEEGDELAMRSRTGLQQLQQTFSSFQ